MQSKADASWKKYSRELLSILRNARNLWRLTSAVQKWTLSASILLMVIGGMANTAVPLLLGRLVDTVTKSSAAGRMTDAGRGIDDISRPSSGTWR